ncbi:MAG: hypothetical protein QOJ50_2784 [Cryptosporangiaceae bacterium]|nr:hypothetical protein [Cryptosporangiaceae bacterium]
MTTPTVSLARRAEALFVSSLQPSEQPSASDVRRAIATSLRAYGGPSGCAARCAAEFGDHPDESANRMRWALHVLTP